MLFGGATGIIFNFGFEILELGAKGSDFAIFGVVDLVGLLPHYPTHVEWQEGSFSVDLVIDGFRAFV